MNRTRTENIKSPQNADSVSAQAMHRGISNINVGNGCMDDLTTMRSDWRQLAAVKKRTS